MTQTGSTDAPPERFVRVSSVVVTDLGDSLMLQKQHSQQRYSLNASGRLVWQHLPRVGLAATAHLLSERFEVQREQAEVDVRRVVRALVAAGFLRVLPTDEEAPDIPAVVDKRGADTNQTR